MLALPFVVACARGEARNEWPVGMTHTSGAELAPEVAGLTPNVRISAVLMRTCHLRFDRIGDTTRFWFDPNALVPEDEDLLLQVARCVSVGPLEGAVVRLVPGAPSGEAPDASAAPGRAERVRRMLLDHGVLASRIETGGADAGARVDDGRVEVDVAP